MSTPEGPYEGLPPMPPEPTGYAAAPSTSEAVAVPDPAGPPSPRGYPVQFEISYPAELNRWLPLVKWLLAIPHYFALFFIGIGAFFVGIWAFFAVLFTGRWPRAAFEYLVGTFRWGYRVAAYLHLMVDPYPPFSMADDPSYPVRLNIEYPERISNWRPLVHWLLAYPYLIVAGIIYLLTGIMSFVAFFTILFTKRIPRGMFELMMPGLRWELRGGAYAYFMVDRYPPWEWG
jgi:hypothetical protein